MKKEVLNEEFIEVNKSVSKTIQFLREQSSICHISAQENLCVYFNCSKTGKISMDYDLGRYNDFSGLFKIYYVYGKVLSKDNKTYVKITSVYKKSDIWLRNLSILILSLLVPILLILKAYFSGHLFIPAFIIAIIPYTFCIIVLNRSTSIRKNRGLEFVKLMENEIKKRVQNIERWEN